MRITQSIMQRTALNTMQGNLRQIAVAQQRVATGLRVQKASDDPVAAAGVMQTDGSLRALEQYRRNIQAAQSRADTEETALDQLSNTLVRAKELAVGASGSINGPAARKVVAAEVEQLLRHVVQLGNTQVAGAYLFGGNAADEPAIVPLDPENPAAGYTVNSRIDPDVRHRTEIAAGQPFEVNHNARQVFTGGDGRPGVLEALQALHQALDSGDADGIAQAADGLGQAFDHVQGLIGDTGARTNQLRVTTANLDALEINLRTFKSDLEEVDLEKAITELVGRQTAFQAAMLATSRVMGMTLADYLR